MNPPARLFPLLLLLLPACLLDEEPEPPSTTAAFLGCPEPICGNTPHLSTRAFWELDANMVQASPVGGFRIVGLVSKWGVALTPVVEDDVFLGRDAGGLLRLVIGGTMRVDSDDGWQYEVYIAEGDGADEGGADGGLHYYEGGHVPTDLPIPTYELTYRLLNGPETMLEPADVCPGGAPHNPRDAVVFQGDRYDLAAGRVASVGVFTGAWFNIACRNDAMWKLHVMRYTQASQGPPPFLTTQDERTAVLRSIRADYCGTGTPNTEEGTHVDWTNIGGWLTRETDTFRHLEARWNKDGATCVNEPRVVEREKIGCYRPPCPTGPPAPGFLTWIE